MSAVNWSTLKAMGISPLAYDYLLAHPREDSDVFALGRAFHAATLEPGTFDDRFVACEIRRDARTKAYQDFLAGVGDRTVMKVDDLAMAQAMAAACRRDPASDPLLAADGIVETRIFWTDSATGIDCAGTPDKVLPGLLLDLKSARDISEHSMTRSVASLGYHAQLAFYLDGLAALGTPIDRVVIIACEKAPPHDVGVFALDLSAIDAGRTYYRSLLRRLAECRAAGRWPGRYDGLPQPLTLPPWADGVPEDISFDD
jgi:hypothetical protein